MKQTNYTFLLQWIVRLEHLQEQGWQQQQQQQQLYVGVS
jgi:hypothetical protein